ncbi:Polygalacturonase [Posidoniimonas polymericola]|uniref:Polygalacturonase n=1 Tax=Posidoniimonas polymericola TaxID=2528002 RepID=A0A5C5YM30_9BACT|nr:glycoside hydrolase family 28 protein [Posidoniimonas polymericola]TWT75974.1 Polygalacturonase [Posidoniimonas polymericola]
MLGYVPIAAGKARAQNWQAPLPTIDQVGAACLPDTIAPIDAPFAMPQLRRPEFPPLTVDIRDKGATPDRKASDAIHAAIAEVHGAGGGTVLIPAGRWRSGRITLRSNVNLHLAEGAELYFSGELADYRPAVFTRHEGVELMSLGACIYALDADNIAVTGRGTLYGPADGPVKRQMMTQAVVEKFVPLDKPVAERVYEGQGGAPVFLPMFISPTRCTNVLIEGVTLEQTAFWNIVPVYCDRVIIRGVTVNSVGIPRGDGIDIESSRNVLIEYSTLNCGDDCFTLKAGRGADGVRVNRPTENVVIRHCLAKQGHGGVTVGSETAGVIRNLYVHDCVFDDTDVGIRLKTRRPRGGGGEHLTYERLRMRLSGKMFRCDMLGSAMYVGELATRLPPRPVDELTPFFRNVTIRNVLVEGATRMVHVTGIPESPLTDFTIENADIRGELLITADDVEQMTFRNVAIHSQISQLHLTDARGLLFDNVTFDVPGGQVEVSISGDRSSEIRFRDCQPPRPAGWQTGAFRNSPSRSQ